MNDTEAEIDGVIARFRELGVRAVAPTHCSGDLTRQRFAQAYGANCLEIGLGAVVNVSELFAKP